MDEEEELRRLAEEKYTEEEQLKKDGVQKKGKGGRHQTQKLDGGPNIKVQRHGTIRIGNSQCKNGLKETHRMKRYQQARQSRRSTRVEEIQTS